MVAVLMETWLTDHMSTPYKLRDVAPEHAERGEALMAQWAEEDKAIDLRARVDAVAELLEEAAS